MNNSNDVCSFLIDVWRNGIEIWRHISSSIGNEYGDFAYVAEEQCRPSPCGANTKCEVIGGTPTCSCLQGFTGSPLSGCRHECESDGECGAQESCQNFKCTSACSQCGTGASCTRVSNHRAVCECPKVCFNFVRIWPKTSEYSSVLRDILAARLENAVQNVTVIAIVHQVGQLVSTVCVRIRA